MCGPEPQHVHQFEAFEMYDEYGRRYHTYYECRCGEQGYAVPA